MFNATKEHATELIGSILEIAAEDGLPVKIVSGELHSGVYDSLQEELRKVLDRELDVQVIVLDPEADIEHNTFAQQILDSEHATILRGRTSQLKDFPHFILAGKECLRVETDHGQTKAEAYYYNPTFGNNLHNIFERLVNSDLVENVEIH